VNHKSLLLVAAAQGFLPATTRVTETNVGRAAAAARAKTDAGDAEGGAAADGVGMGGGGGLDLERGGGGGDDDSEAGDTSGPCGCLLVVPGEVRGFIFFRRSTLPELRVYPSSLDHSSLELRVVDWQAYPCTLFLFSEWLGFFFSARCDSRTLLNLR